MRLGIMEASVTDVVLFVVNEVEMRLTCPLPDLDQTTNTT